MNRICDALYFISKKELKDRNHQRQLHKGAPNIPEGTKFFIFPHQSIRFKFVDVVYKRNVYTVKFSDLELKEAGYYSYHDRENYIMG